MIPTVLTVYKCPFPKKRLGKQNDGGYVIAEIPGVHYTTLLAGGISNDISFEEDFVNMYPNVRAFAFDGTIPRLPKPNPRITFIRKNIGFENSASVTNLHAGIDANEGLFVKMDIEGGEVPWIQSLSDEQMNRFEQIVMEFHFPFSSKEIEMFDKINKNHRLIHFHGNNCCGSKLHRGVVIPEVFECTYVHKKHISSPELNVEPVPTPLDMKNTVENAEIYLNYPPFVNSTRARQARPIPVRQAVRKALPAPKRKFSLFHSSSSHSKLFMSV